MPRDRKDRSENWFMAKHGGSLLRLGQITNFTAWRAAPTVLGYPKQMPDGLLDVSFPGKAAPDPFLIEIETYPEQDTIEQIQRDVAIVFLNRRVVPDVLLLILRPKGNLHIAPEQIAPSEHGTTELRLKFRVVNLWTIPADDLLAAHDVGLIPWLPLTQNDEDPSKLLRLCRQRIVEGALPEEQENLLVMTRVMAEMRYNDPCVLTELGGNIMSLSLERAMLKSPALQRIVTEKERQAAEKAAEKATEKATEALAATIAEKDRELVEKQRDIILQILRKRFGSVPKNLAVQLGSIETQAALDDLLNTALDCADVKAFRGVLAKR